MSPRDPFQPLPSRPRAPRPRRRATIVALAASLAPLVLGILARPALSFELRLSTENDLLVESRHKDDLYTFAIGLELERGPYTVALRENAFTDRLAGRRFDETHLSVARDLPAPAGWELRAEAGAVHVGRGLFGESTQNAVHEAIGGDDVRLPYEDSSLHARLAVAGERPFALGERLVLGPRLEIDAAPGLRSHAVLGAQARWRPHELVAVEALAGIRLSDAAHPALEPHLVDRAPVVRLGALLLDHIVLAWSYNDYGDEREHLSLGYKVAGRRPWRW
jgi:hypothetical protein